MSSCAIQSSFFSSSFFSCYSRYYLVVAYLAVRQIYIINRLPNHHWILLLHPSENEKKRREKEKKKIVSVFLGLQIHTYTHTILLPFADVGFFLLLLLLFVFSMHARKDQWKTLLLFFLCTCSWG